MHLSISSFNQQVAKFNLLSIFGAAFLISMLFACVMEIDLAILGYQPTVQDSPERWAKERVRASQLGAKALILTGNSRFQLGLDLDNLRTATNLEPVQLAIDGSSFFPVLKSLADDPKVTGTILVDFSPDAVESIGLKQFDNLDVYEHAYIKLKDQQHKLVDFSLAQTEIKFTKFIHENLRSYADGATPFMSLLTRILPQRKAEQYLTTRSDRSRLADYHNNSIRQIYYRRVARTLGLSDGLDATETNAESILRSKIDTIQAHSTSNFALGAQQLKTMKEAIEARGGKVYFIQMPTSGMVREIEDKRYPEKAFLDVFEHETGTKVLASSNVPKLKQFSCPDGSHLDMRDRASFSENLVHALGIGSK